MKFSINDLQVLRGVHGISLVLPVPLSEADSLLALQKKLGEGKSLEVEIKTPKKARTLSANAFCWVLCDEIARALSKNGEYTSKEDVYREAIKDSGYGVHMALESEEAMKRFSDIWQRNGIGWVTQEIGRNELIAYYGSSVYDREQMARLIDCLLAEAKTQGIPLRASAEIEEMLAAWD